MKAAVRKVMKVMMVVMEASAAHLDFSRKVLLWLRLCRRFSSISGLSLQARGRVGVREGVEEVAIVEVRMRVF